MWRKPVLALDCSGPWVGLVLGHDGEIHTSFHEMQRGQAEHLIALAEALLLEAGLDYKDLSAIAVGRGPGNFTGLRIAISAARGLALGLDCPCMGIDRFEATAAKYGTDGLAVIPAPRDQAYVQDMRKGEAPAFWSAEDLARSTAPRLPELISTDHAAMILQCALARLDKGDELPPATPLYIKPADAAPAAPGPVLLA